MKKRGRTDDLRCEACGQWLPYDDGQIVTRYIPDSPFTAESTEIYHAHCAPPCYPESAVNRETLYR